MRKNGAIQQGVARGRCNMVVESQNKAHYSTQDCASRSFGVVVSFWCVFVVVFCAVSAVVLWCVWGGVFVVVFLWWCVMVVFLLGFLVFLAFGVVGLFGCVFVVVFCAVSVVVLVLVWWRYFLVCFCGVVLCFFCGGFGGGGGGGVRAQRLPSVRSLLESCVSMQTWRRKKMCADVWQIKEQCSKSSKKCVRMIYH